MTASLRQAIAAHYRGLEIVSEVSLDGRPTLIVYSPATQAVVRDDADLERFFAAYRMRPAAEPTGEPRQQARQGFLF